MTDRRDGLFATLQKNSIFTVPRSGVHSAGPGRSPLRLAQEWLPRTPGPLLLRGGRRQGEDHNIMMVMRIVMIPMTRCTAGTSWRLTTAPVCTPASGSAAPTPRSCPPSGSSRSDSAQQGPLTRKISHFCSNIVQKERNYFLIEMLLWPGWPDRGYRHG